MRDDDYGTGYDDPATDHHYWTVDRYYCTACDIYIDHGAVYNHDYHGGIYYVTSVRNKYDFADDLNDGA